MKRYSTFLLLWLFLAAPLQAATVTLLQGTETTWLTSASTLANNGQVYGASAITGVNGYLGGWCTLNITTASAATAGSAIVAWFRVSTDGGTTYPDGDSGSTLPAEAPNMIFPLRAASGTQVVTFQIDNGKMPVGTFKLLMANQSGVTLNANWSIKCKPHTLQVN